MKLGSLSLPPLGVALLFPGCTIIPHTHRTDRMIGERLPAADSRVENHPCIDVRVESAAGDLYVGLCSRGWDYRRINVLSDQCSLTDIEGRRYRLAPFKSNDYVNKEIGASRWIQYKTYACEPSTGKRQSAYGSPHTLRVVYEENGRYYIAEIQFAATYHLITPFNFLPLTDP